MGTSKGYISPARTQWTNAKRAVGAMIKNPTSGSISKAASKYSTAMKSDMNSTQGATFVSAAAGILGFINKASSGGIRETLKEIGREDLLDKSLPEIWEELLYMYTNDGKSDEDAVALAALSLATKNLKIDLEHLENVETSVLLKEMIVDFICIKFEFHYEEKVGKRKTPLEKQKILESMKKYIRANVYEELTLNDIQTINFGSLSGNQYVNAALREAFTTLEELYMEE